MKLAPKLFLSYLIVVGLALLVLALSTALVAPANFSHMMGGQGHGNMMRQGEHRAALDAELDATFREAVNTALLYAGITATLAAIGISWLVSLQIVRPIQAMVKASQHIASGHYAERLTVPAHDEIGELTASFNQMAAALESTEAIRLQLLADVTHELKTPLASIKGLMEGLQDGVIQPAPDTFHLIYQEADRLQRLVQDLQALSRAEAHQLKLRCQPIDPTTLVQAALDQLQPQFAEKGVHLCNDLPPHLPLILADADRTKQVILNLLGNALQYTPVAGQVKISAVVQPQLLCLAVQDTGIGLSAFDIERVFMRFYRVDKSRARGSGGSGIGLTIARHIVEAQGGQLWAASPGADQGSTFSFTLPLA